MSTVFKDYYKILHVSPGATIDEIKAGYRKLAFKYHPDRGGSAKIMGLLNEAYSVLSDSSLRANYDEIYQNYHANVHRNTDSTIRDTNELIQVLVTAKKSASAYAKRGAAWLVVGFAFTVGSYKLASPGGQYFVAWGAMLVGGYQFVKGLHYFFNPHLLVKKSMGTEAYERTFSELPLKTSWKVVLVILGIIALGLVTAGVLDGSQLTSSANSANGQQSSAAAGSSSDNTSTSYSSAQDAFTINFPGNPTSSNSSSQIQGVTVPYDTYYSSIDNDSKEYAVYVYNWPSNSFDFSSLSQTDLQSVINDSLTGVVQTLNGSVTNSSYLNFEGNLCEDAQFNATASGNTFTGYIRVFFVGNREYGIVSLGASHDDFYSFATSFQSD